MAASDRALHIHIYHTIKSHWLHWFDFSPLCVFKCCLKLPDSEKAYSHWLHLYDLSPLCAFKCFFKSPAREDAYSHWLDLFGFSPFLVFLKGISNLTLLSLKSSSGRCWSITTKKGMLSLAYCHFQTETITTTKNDTVSHPSDFSPLCPPVPVVLVLKKRKDKDILKPPNSFSIHINKVYSISWNLSLDWGRVELTLDDGCRISTLHHHDIFPPVGNMTGGNMLVGRMISWYWHWPMYDIRPVSSSLFTIYSVSKPDLQKIQI